MLLGEHLHPWLFMHTDMGCRAQENVMEVGVLTAYSYRDLQMFAQLLTDIGSGVSTVQELSGAVEQAMRQRMLSISSLAVTGPPPPASQCPTIRPDGSRCRGRLIPAKSATGKPLIDGLSIFGCPLCRYSEVR